MFSPNKYGNVEGEHVPVLDRLVRGSARETRVLYIGVGGFGVTFRPAEIRPLFGNYTGQTGAFVLADHDDLPLSCVCRDSGSAEWRQFALVKADARRLQWSFLEGDFDMVMAFGLFGDLHGVQSPNRLRAFSDVLQSLAYALCVNGKLLVSNSLLRQPKDEFISLARTCGLTVLKCLEGSERYLAILTKRPTRVRETPRQRRPKRVPLNSGKELVTIVEP